MPSHCNHVSTVPPSGDQKLDTGALDDALHPNHDTAQFLFYEVSNYNRQSASQRGKRREGGDSEQSVLGGTGSFEIREKLGSHVSMNTLDGHLHMAS